MNELKYKLKEIDFLQLHLYFFGKDGLFKKYSRRIIFIFLGLIFVGITICILKKENIYAISLFITGFLILVFHKKNMKKKYEKHFTKCIQQYKNRFDKNVELKFTESEIEIKSVAGNTQLYNSQIKSIIETEGYFFIRLNPEGIIIPKRELEKENGVKEYLILLSKKLKVEYIKDFEWKW